MPIFGVFNLSDNSAKVPVDFLIHQLWQKFDPPQSLIIWRFFKINDAELPLIGVIDLRHDPCNCPLNKTSIFLS